MLLSMISHHPLGTTVTSRSKAAQNNCNPTTKVNIGSASAVFLKNIHDVLVSGTILVYGIWNMVCGIWYENGIHSVFAYVLCASSSGCLQHSASIPCFNVYISSLTISRKYYHTMGLYSGR